VTYWGLGVDPALALVLAVVWCGCYRRVEDVAACTTRHRERLARQQFTAPASSAATRGASARPAPPGAAPTDHTQAERDRYPDCGR
jgi:hypothetical protein